MSQFALVTVAALLVYFALRVWQIKRRSLPFVIAYPLFVAILLGGGLAVFVGASNAAAALGFGAEDPLTLGGVLGVTAVGLLALSWVARRAIT